jgi:DNA-binding MarR family transcriptional regulator
MPDRTFPEQELASLDLPGAMLPHLGFVLGKVAASAHRRVDDALAELDIRAQHFGVLTVLDAEGPLRQSQIGERLRIDRTTMVALVDHLEGLGAVIRAPDADDRRAYAVTLTATGRERLARANRIVTAVQTDWLAPLSPEELAGFKAALLKLARHID